MSLKPKQKRAVEILVANPELKAEEVAEQVGVSYSTLWRWSKLDDFKEYQHELCLQRFTDLERIAIKKLKENAMNNNQRAIEYCLNFLGYKPVEEIKADVKTDIVIDIDE